MQNIVSPSYECVAVTMWHTSDTLAGATLAKPGADSAIVVFGHETAAGVRGAVHALVRFVERFGAVWSSLPVD